MKKKLFIPILFIVLATTGINAQYRDTNLKYTFPQFWTETGHYFTTPLHWGGTDFLMLGSLAAGTAIALAVEKPAPDITNGNFTTRLFYNSFPAKFGNFYGGLWTPFILFGGYGGYSLITGDIKARKIAYEIGQADLYAAAIVVALKYSVGRARPYMNLGKSSFFNFSLKNDGFHSFPSGHCTEAFAMSTVLMMNTDDIWWKILAYIPAPFTIFSRYYQGYHWLSDCILGAGIGFFTAKWCADAHGRIDDPAGQKTGSLEIKSLWPFTLSYAFN